MIRAHENLAILSAEAPINSPLMTDGSAFVQLEEEFRQAFETTVIDLPRNMLINFPHLLADVNVVVLATEMTLASARDTIRILSWLKTNASHAQPLIIANKVQPGVAEISKADFEASIERKIDVLIPFEQKVAAQAAKLGKPLAEVGKSAKSLVALGELATRITAITDSGERDDKTAKSAKGSKGSSLLDKIKVKKILEQAGYFAVDLGTLDVGGWLASLAPSDPEYQALSAEYLRYKARAPQDKGPPIANGDKILVIVEGRDAAGKASERLELLRFEELLVDGQGRGEGAQVGAGVGRVR